jgi:hypothetical protein
MRPAKGAVTPGEAFWAAFQPRPTIWTRLRRLLAALAA